jgi:CHAT domain-containing protein/Tfp pilus assembly protein PilF
MRRLRSWWPVALCLALAGVDGLAQHRATLQERDRLRKVAQAHLQAGNLDEAIAAAGKVLALERQIYGPAHEEIANTWNVLAPLYEEKESFTKARRALLERQKTRARLYGASDWRTVDVGLELRDLEIRAGMSPIQRRRANDLHSEAAALNDRAHGLYQQGRFADATDLLVRTLPLCLKLYPAQRYPEGQPELAALLNNLGFLLQHRGELATAQPFLREALAMRQKLYPAQRYPQGHPDVATILNNLGLLFQQRGELATAEPFYRDALAMWRKLYPPERYLHGHSDLATVLNNMGSVTQARGDLGSAEPFMRDALAMCRELYPPEAYPRGHRDLARALNDLGNLIRDQGQLEKAEPLLRDALSMYKKLHPVEDSPHGHPDLARSLNNLGTLLHERGELGHAEPFLREALAMRQRLFPAGRYPQGHADLDQGLNNLGYLLMGQGKLGQAERLLRENLAMCQVLYPAERFPQGHLDVAKALNNLGGLLIDRGELLKGETFYRDALAMYRQLYPSDRYPHGHPELANGLNNLGMLLQERGEVGQAERLLRDALAMKREVYRPERYPDGHPNLAISLTNLGLLLYARGERAQAEPYAREALGMYQARLRRLGELYGETEALNFAAPLPLTRDIYLFVTGSLPRDPREYAAVWQGKGTLLRIATRRHADLLAQQDSRTRALGVELSDVRSQLIALLAQPLDDLAEHHSRLRKWTERKEVLERAIAQKLNQRTEPAAGPVPSPDDLRHVLPPRAVFVDFLRYVRCDYDPRKPGREGETRTPCYVAFILSKEQPPMRVELGEAGPIERALQEWRQDINVGGHSPTPSSADSRLTERIWQPLVKHIPPRTDLVYLCPDAALTQLPWAALPTSLQHKPGGLSRSRVMLEDYTLALVPHPLYLLEQLQAKPRPSGEGDLLLAYGAVRYDQPPGATEEKPPVEAVGPSQQRGPTARVRWHYLPGTEQELAGLLAQASRPKTLVRRGSQASLAQLLRDLPQARWAHLATHGFFADAVARSMLQLTPEDYERARWGGRVGVGLRNPLLLSGLVLAGANRKGQDSTATYDPAGGILTGEGLLALPLEHLDLAVLSACETGLGDVAGGEGVFGLQRAFHVCGCKNVVASLWKVDDDATAALMAVFYHQLWVEKLPPLEALRQAQQRLMHHPKEVPILARGRGVLFEETVRRPDRPAAPKGQRPKTSPVKYWAAFVLSGSGR